MQCREHALWGDLENRAASLAAEGGAGSPVLGGAVKVPVSSKNDSALRTGAIGAVGLLAKTENRGQRPCRSHAVKRSMTIRTAFRRYPVQVAVGSLDRGRVRLRPVCPGEIDQRFQRLRGSARGKNADSCKDDCDYAPCVSLQQKYGHVHLLKMIGIPGGTNDRANGTDYMSPRSPPKG